MGERSIIMTFPASRCYLELANYEKSFKYGKESYEAAMEAADEVWQLNTSVLLAQSQGEHKTTTT